MADIDPNTEVCLNSSYSGDLCFPPSGVDLVVAVEDASLKSASRLTTVVEIDGGNIKWCGSIDEAGLAQQSTKYSGDARDLLTQRLFQGRRLWDVIQPGLLRQSASTTIDTVYQGNRPWIVVGELTNGNLLAVPLNDLGSGVRRHYQSFVDKKHLQLNGMTAKDSKAELNHLWSFPKTTQKMGTVDQAAHACLEQGLRGYYPGRTQ